MITSKTNFAALSVWHQLTHRPDFVNAFKAISEVKKRYRESDPFGRYFALNAYYTCFNDYKTLENSVFYGIPDLDAQIIWDDDVYGMGKNESALYRWVKAMNGTNTSDEW